jgi:hypothetical protein
MANSDCGREAFKAAAEAKSAAEHSYLKTKAHAERVKAASTLIERLDEYQDAPVVIDQAKEIVAILDCSAEALVKDAGRACDRAMDADDKTFGAYYGVDESAAD